MAIDATASQEASRADTEQEVEFRPPVTPYHRKECLRIVLPGVDTPDARLEGVRRVGLLQLINDVTSDRNVERVELLSFPTGGAQEYLLHATSATIGVSGKAASQSKLSEFNGMLQAPVRNRLESVANNRLPTKIGLERVDVDFSPLGRSAVPTCRLIVEDGREMTPSGTLNYHPVARTLVALEAAGEPHLYQVLVTDMNGGYRITVRLATYRPCYNIVSDREFASHVLHGHDWDLARMYEPANVTSNFRISTSEHWGLRDPREYDLPDSPLDEDLSEWGRVGYTLRRGWVDYKERGYPREVRKLVIGKPEHERLLRGTNDHPELYKVLCGYPWFDVNGPQLGYFVELAPVYPDTNPWDRLHHRGAPALTTDTILRSAAGTEQAMGQGTIAAPPEPPDAVQNVGSADHRGTVSLVPEWFGELGDDVEPVEQTSDSVPDLWLYPTDGRIVALDYETESDAVHIEVEINNKSKPAKLLGNAARAIWHDREVVIVCNSEREARDAIAKLREPFRGSNDSGETWLYNGSVVTLPDGTTPAIPGEHAKSRWWLSPDGDLRLTAAIDRDVASEYEVELGGVDYADGGDTVGTTSATTAPDSDPDPSEPTIATGPATDGTDTFEYACPRYRATDDGVVIETPGGERLAQYPSPSACKQEWSRVYWPHVPLRLSYLESAIVMYQDGEELEMVKPDPEWDVPGHTDRYSGAVEEFVETYLVDVSGAELQKTEFRDRALRWYRRQTNRKAPNKTHFGRATPDLETNSREDNRYVFFEDRTWRYPLGIVSPDVPGIGGDSVLDAAEAE